MADGSELLVRALCDPASLSAGDVDFGALEPEVLIAILYGRPELISSEAAEALRPLLRTPKAGAVAGALRLLVFSDAARGVVEAALDALRGADTPEALRVPLLEVLREAACWRPELVGLDHFLAVLDGFASDEQASAAANVVVERLFYARPEAFDPAAAERAARSLGGSPRFSYLCALLKRESPHTPGVIRDSSFRLLVVVNSRFGQGDEILRTAPLLQAVVDASPAAAITVLTRRTYLFDHPQIESFSILDDAAVARALARDYDGVAHFYEPLAPHFNCRPMMTAAVEAAIRRMKPRLVLRGDHADHRFGFQTACLDGREHAAGAFDPITHNLYAPTLRLLMELGLPVRLGEQAPQSAWVLAGTPSEDAERLWATLAGDGRPVALVNPFGGSKAEKGYTSHHYEQLACELAGLVEEGYRLLLLPNGTAWGDRGAAAAVLRLLPEEVKNWVAVAPDPGELLAGRRVRLTERAELSHSDRIMRLFKYFVARADLVVTVEGWMSHLAYNLGRPFRLVLMAHSPPPAWYPLARGTNQRLVTEMSPQARVEYAPADAVSGCGGTPFPRLYRKQMLEFVLDADGASRRDDWFGVLKNVLASADPDLRRLAVEILGRSAGEVSGVLRSALDDLDGTVRASAAEALLERGEGPEDLMRAHVAVAKGDWAALDRLRSGVLPALAAAACEPNQTVREDALHAAARSLWPRYATNRVAIGAAAFVLWAVRLGRGMSIRRGAGS